MYPSIQVCTMVKFGTSIRSKQTFPWFRRGSCSNKSMKTLNMGPYNLETLNKTIYYLLNPLFFFLTTAVKRLRIGPHPVALPNNNLSRKRAGKNQQLITSIQRLFNGKLTPERRQFIANISTNLRNKFN